MTKTGFLYQCFNTKSEDQILYVVSYFDSYNLVQGLQDAFKRGFTAKDKNFRDYYIGASLRQMYIALDAPEGSEIPEDLVDEARFIEGKYKIKRKEVVSEESNEAILGGDLNGEFEVKEEVEKQAEVSETDTPEESSPDFEGFRNLNNNKINRKVIVKTALSFGVELDEEKYKSVNTLVKQFEKEYTAS